MYKMIYPSYRIRNYSSDSIRILCWYGCIRLFLSCRYCYSLPASWHSRRNWSEVRNIDAPCRIEIDACTESQRVGTTVKAGVCLKIIAKSVACLLETSTYG